jgi:hypothetical protein
MGQDSDAESLRRQQFRAPLTAIATPDHAVSRPAERARACDVIAPRGPAEPPRQLPTPPCIHAARQPGAVPSSACACPEPSAPPADHVLSVASNAPGICHRKRRLGIRRHRSSPRASATGTYGVHGAPAGHGRSLRRGTQSAPVEWGRDAAIVGEEYVGRSAAVRSKSELSIHLSD